MLAKYLYLRLNRQRREHVRESLMTMVTVALQGTRQVNRSQKQESASSEPVKKRARKALNKKERENLHEYLNAVDVSVLNDAVQQKISEQCLSGSFKSFVDVLYTNEDLCLIVESFVNRLQDLVQSWHNRFGHRPHLRHCQLSHSRHQ